MGYTLSVLKVFVDENDLFGNPVGIISDTTGQISNLERQSIARELGFSETVFIDGGMENKISIYTPMREIVFAGHAVVGVAKFLEVPDTKVIITTKGGKEVSAWCDGDKIWIETDINDLPDWNLKQMNCVEEVESMSNEESRAYEHTYVWVYMNEEKNKIKARTFASDWGIPEDEANGSGSILLTVQLQKNLTIYHGEGSCIQTEYIRPEIVRVGGRVAVESVVEVTKLLMA